LSAGIDERRPIIDYRYMACADLLTEVARDGFTGFPSRDLERETMDGVMRAVFDASADVAGLAMKCASAVARRMAGAVGKEAAPAAACMATPYATLVGAVALRAARAASAGEAPIAPLKARCAAALHAM